MGSDATLAPAPDALRRIVREQTALRLTADEAEALLEPLARILAEERRNFERPRTDPATHAIGS